MNYSNTNITEMAIVSRDAGLDGLEAGPRSISCLLTARDGQHYSLDIQTQDYFAEACAAQDQEGLLDERPAPVFVVPEAVVDDDLVHQILGGLSFDLLQLYLVPQRPLGDNLSSPIVES